MAKIFFPSSKEAQKASRLAAKGELFRIRNGIYIDTHDPEEITKTLNNNWMEVACNIFDGPVAVASVAGMCMFTLEYDVMQHTASGFNRDNSLFL